MSGYTLEFPCKRAKKIPKGKLRGEHIKNCVECQELMSQIRSLYKPSRK